MARLLFMGSPEIAVPSLKALVRAGHEIPVVITQPDRPKGRGQQVSPPPVKVAALQLGLEVLQPSKVKTPDFAEQLRSFDADGICVVAYGRILPKSVLEATPLGCLNVHFSLLPKYRGAACVAYALINGEEETGVTTMLIDEGLDTGPILMQWTEAIRPDDTTETLSRRLADLGAKQLVTTLQALESATLKPVPQNEEDASYAPLLKKSEGRVDWSQSSQQIYHRYQGLTPWPGLFTFLGGKRIVLTELKPGDLISQGSPGTLLWEGQGSLRVQCGQGQLEILRLKPEGKKILTAPEFMRGQKNKDNILRFL